MIASKEIFCRWHHGLVQLWIIKYQPQSGRNVSFHCFNIKDSKLVKKIGRGLQEIGIECLFMLKKVISKSFCIPESFKTRI